MDSKLRIFLSHITCLSHNHRYYREQWRRCMSNTWWELNMVSGSVMGWNQGWLLWILLRHWKRVIYNWKGGLVAGRDQVTVSDGLSIMCVHFSEELLIKHDLYYHDYYISVMIRVRNGMGLEFCEVWRMSVFYIIDN